MLSLQQVGLVEKILGTPIKYRALPLKRAVEMLFRNKTRQYQELQLETKHLLKKSEAIPAAFEATHEFVLIPENEAHVRRIDQAHANARTSIHTMMTYVGEPSLHDLPESLQEAIARGVKVKVISNKPQEKNPSMPHKSVWTKKGSYEVRYSDKPLPVMFASVDQKEVFIATNPKPNPLASGALWTNNPCLITIIEDYFKRTWKKAKPPE